MLAEEFIHAFSTLAAADSSHRRGGTRAGGRDRADRRGGTSADRARLDRASGPGRGGVHRRIAAAGDQHPLAGATKVTLVTGDVVSYLPNAKGGAPQVEVAPAPRGGGRSVSFTHLREGDAFYVFPSDARGLIGAGRLERGLFDVTYLVKNGFADDASKELPLIVQYPKSVRDAKVLSTKTDALPATATPKALPAVSSAAVKVTKKQAARFWASVDSPNPAGRAAAPTLDAGVSKIWLDHRTKALLDKSVPQIGAPEAWKAGYDGTGVTVAVLDTGIDDTHPDLTGKVRDSKSFIDGEVVKDGHGHGTHVASTIVGSGAASGGKYKGVAPGAELIVGKILANNGYGADSAIIAGMQWAAQSGAKIISISVGGMVTDGNDPLSQAVNELSAQYGALFVIAAGNSGGFQQVNAPGAADAALTVAAVDKQDQMASFSSRGPRRGDYGLKPDIAAPGVDITAAKADGTALPERRQRQVHDHLGHLDGHPTRLGRRGDPRPGTPGLDRAENQAGTHQHQQGPRPRHQLPGRRPGRRRPGDHPAGVRDEQR